MQFEVVSRTHVGLKRALNEDNLLVSPDLGLFVVADGMGGHEAGEVASSMIVGSLGALAAQEDEDELLRQALVALEKVNGALRVRAGGEGHLIGSTVVGVLLGQGRLRCFWAGDSRAYLLRGASLTQLSRDHSLVQQLVDAGMLDPDRAHDHPNGNMITRAVGAADELRTDVVEHDLAAGDLILLASDGVTRVVTDGELASALRSPAPLAETADGLVWTVLQRGAPDNLTFILLRISD
jgi:serine/threonine protein phosphatase PrpC